MVRLPNISRSTISRNWASFRSRPPMSLRGAMPRGSGVRSESNRTPPPTPGTSSSPDPKCRSAMVDAGGIGSCLRCLALPMRTCTCLRSGCVPWGILLRRPSGPTLESTSLAQLPTLGLYLMTTSSDLPPTQPCTPMSSSPSSASDE